MQIYIPSAGRARKQVTLRSLKLAGVLGSATLVVPERDRLSYQNLTGFDGVSIVYLPPEFDGIAKTREWILTKGGTPDDPRVCMLDDDMDFCWRPDVTKPALETIKDGARMRDLLDTLERWLNEGFVHVGLSARQGNNHPFNNGSGVSGLWPYRDVTRMMNAYAYDVNRLRMIIERGEVILGRVPVMEDFDLTLQLLRMGDPNRVSYEYCWNQRGSGADGGCSTYRTSAVQAAAAHELHRLHPDFVKVVTKSSPSQQGAMAERVDVTVQWGKAYDNSRTPVRA